MSGWRRVELGQVADEVTVGHVGSMASLYQLAGIPFLRSQNVTPHAIDLTGVKYIGEEFHQRLTKSELRPGDVVTVRTGKPGITAVMPDNLPVANCSDLVITRTGPDLDAQWLSYYMNSAAEGYISAQLVGAVQQHFNVGAAKKLVLHLPPLAEQRAIAEVLGALDDKIAANTKLSRIADDYVRARYEEVERTSKESMAVSKLATARRDTVDPSSTVSGTLYVGLEHIPRRSMWLGDSGYAADVTSQKSSFERDDILFGKLRPYFHKVVAAPHAGVSSTDILVLTATIADLNGFVLAALASDSVVASVTAMSEGTRMPRTSWKDLSAVEVPWPGEARAKEFSADTIVLRSAVEGLLEENKTLAATRDALLPQLMSGKLRVRNAETAVEAVV